MLPEDDLEIDLDSGEFDSEVESMLAELRGVEYRTLKYGDPKSPEYQETLREIESIKASLKAKGYKIEHIN